MQALAAPKTYAGLGRRDDAIREATLTLELHGERRDSSMGERFQEVAQIHMLLGNQDQAVEYLERVLNALSFVSVPALKMDPTWQELRDHPGFIAMLAQR